MHNMSNLLHYRALKFVYPDEWSTFQELLIKDESVSMHHTNLQYLAIELCKVKSGNAPFLMNEIFTTRDIPENSVITNLRSQTNFYNYYNPKSVRFGTETLRAFDIKNPASLAIFKQKIKSWTSVNCPCRLCINHVEGLGFAQPCSNFMSAGTIEMSKFYYLSFILIVN